MALAIFGYRTEPSYKEVKAITAVSLVCVYEDLWKKMRYILTIYIKKWCD